MTKQVGKKFAWVIKNFSSLQCKKFYSVPFQIGDCKWRLSIYPKGNNCDYLSLFLEVADFKSLPSGWRRYVKLRLYIVKQLSTLIRKTHRWFDQEMWGWGFLYMLPLTKLHDEKEGFLVNGELMIVAEVDALGFIDPLNESEESEDPTQPLKKIKLNDDGAVSSDLLEEASPRKESMEVNGFQVLPSQVESVRLIFERHPDIASEFRAKNQYLRKACMDFLLSLVETLCQSLQEFSNEDLVEADIALTYLKDAGFKVDWLEKKLDQVRDKKEKERSCLAKLQETEETLLKLKQKCTELDALMDTEKAELSAIRTPLSFEDVV
ncbi:TRAF-like family protein [Arabidopsis thaliana]|uniref:MATH domain and coiled-coil domain-containing protein At3g58410 n=1 Tax=Arabidopsis thaliana TaxID=3702 RepID=MCC29_ARATH|nr:TRAF-like family protein [Arabidopsis thaliana]Q9M2H5.2 RecName: Full=MATH domain and coiled-coil domain-containing protein At3g58410; AltName: Full=RTM3-like protein At3g58410 [Arabidopsis thaliana]ANM64063.1 TRAF-like family protein [Arabidopsis thaliana]|eukprot:NP_001326114.1 TRAF-like family protein [Arabidopsis thaliana]